MTDDIGVIGLDNINSVCYLNSLFQCLISCPSFITLVNQLSSPNSSSIKYMINAYRKGEKNTISQLINSINPSEEQQCVHETFHYIVDRCGLEGIFEMVITEMLICTTCSKIIDRKIDKQIVFHHFEDKNLTSDIIEKSNSVVKDFYCNRCKKKTQIIIKRFLTQLPHVLVVCLNKFFDKDDISYPESLEIHNINYTLVADINHTGNMNGGHYFARIRRRHANNSYKYFRINDNIVDEIPSLKPTKNAYLLFFTRV